jgi:hypothetical protein
MIGDETVRDGTCKAREFTVREVLIFDCQRGQCRVFRREAFEARDRKLA